MVNQDYKCRTKLNLYNCIAVRNSDTTNTDPGIREGVNYSLPDFFRQGSPLPPSVDWICLPNKGGIGAEPPPPFAESPPL